MLLTASKFERIRYAVHLLRDEFQFKELIRFGLTYRECELLRVRRGSSSQ